MTPAFPARSPALFQRLPERIFAPLASANRRQYWHLLCVLYDKRFGPDAPLPPSSGFLLREITADIAAAIEHQDWVLEEVEATPQTPLANRAYMVFSRLRDSGWLQVERLGVREVVLMPPAVAHFIGRLIEFAHTGPEFVSGKIRSIEANLKLLLHEDADGASLQEAARQSRALLEHIHIASTHVRDLMREIGDIEVTGEFVRRFFDDYVERIFIADYKELRTRDHPLTQRRLADMFQQAQDFLPPRQRVFACAQFFVIGDKNAFDVIIKETAHKLARRFNIADFTHQVAHIGAGDADMLQQRARLSGSFLQGGAVSIFVQ